MTHQPKYKLTYFDGRGLGEPIRYLFKYGNIDFEDVRVRVEDKALIKTTTPFGTLPTLEFQNNQVISGQSVAIARYVGKLVGLGGKTDLENLQIDSIVDTFSDFRTKLRPVRFEENAETRKILLEIAKNETIPFYLSRFEKIVEKNNGYLALGRLTWADVYFAGISSIIKHFTGLENVFDSYPNLSELIKKIENLPTIKNWLENSPIPSF